MMAANIDFNDDQESVQQYLYTANNLYIFNASW